MADMATSPELLGVRDTLNNKYNIADERIGWDGQYVTIDGKQAIKPMQNAGGRAMADQSAIASAVQPFQQIQTVAAPQTGISSTSLIAKPSIAQQLGDIRSELATLFPETANPVDQQFSELLETLSGRLTDRSPIDLDDVYDSPQWAAQEAQIARQSQQATRQAQEALGASNFGRSTRLQDRARAIQNEANNYLNTQAAPAIMQALQNEQDRETAALMDFLGILGQERQFQDSREQNEFDRMLGLLGYQTGREDVAYDRQYQRERDAITDQRYENEFDYQQQRDAVADQRYADEVAYRQARDAIADERWKMEFDEDVRRFGLEYAMQQALRQDRLSSEAADRALRARSIANEERSLNLREQEASQAAGAEFMTERQGLVNAIRSGELTPGQALQQIEEDARLGFYTPEQAALLRQDLQTIAANAPTPAATPEQTAAVEEYRGTIPSDREIEAEARRLGYPLLDYRSYYKSPNGRMAGVTFEQWRTLYGPGLR